MQTAIPVLICAYNEEKHITTVLTNIQKSSNERATLASIVIDDGSTDHTSEKAREAGAYAVLRLPSNKGKGTAWYRGASYALTHFSSDRFLSLDGDIAAVSPEQVALLLAPLGQAHVQMTIGSVCGAMSSLSGQRGYTRTFLKELITDARYAPLLSGERGIRTGYGLEVLLNHYATGCTDPTPESTTSKSILFVPTELTCQQGSGDMNTMRHKQKALGEVERMRQLLRALTL